MSSQEKIFEENTTDFALNLFREEAKLKTGAPKCENMFLSPTSIVVALAMAQKGADGETKRQMFQGLFGNKVDEQIVDKKLADLCKFLAQQDKTPGYTLNSASRLFCDKKYPFLKSYLDVVKSVFKADLENLDFAHDSQNAVRKINEWVDKQTHGKIQKLFEQLDNTVKMVITNAIYFKGDWKFAFKADSTYEQDFHVNEKLTKKLQFMHQKEDFSFTKNEKASLLSMSYVNENLSMVFILPQQRFGLVELEKNLTGVQLWKWIDSMKCACVRVSIPKFKLETSMKLVDALKQLGMVDMFKEGANFSKMSAQNDLYVSDVVHKAFLEVNEEGSEAAAVTAVVMTKCLSARVPRVEPEIFTADRPFMFAIVEKSTKSLLFMGHFHKD